MPWDMRMALKLAVFLSGNGTTLQNLIDRCASGELDCEITCVVSSRAEAYGLERARDSGIPALAIPRKEFADSNAFCTAIWDALSEYEVELVVLAGFMSLLTVPKAFEGRIMNVHPALIPSFCGKGMYGERVHQAVLDKGVKVTGVTVHFVDEEYDCGPIVLQNAVPVLEGDTAETLAARVQEEERKIYPRAIQLFAEDRLRVDGRTVHILPR